VTNDERSEPTGKGVIEPGASGAVRAITRFAHHRAQRRPDIRKVSSIQL